LATDWGLTDQPATAKQLRRAHPESTTETENEIGG
jgi:hypothetical protein